MTTRHVPLVDPDGRRTVAILSVGEASKRLILNGKEYRFSRDYTGGPWFESKSGEVLNEPGERHPFWRAFYAWTRQGERMDGNLCLWDPMPKRRVRRMTKRDFVVVHEPEGWMEMDGTEIID